MFEIIFDFLFAMGVLGLLLSVGIIIKLRFGTKQVTHLSFWPYYISVLFFIVSTLEMGSQGLMLQVYFPGRE